MTVFEGFGELLTALREQAGLTQREAGQRSSLSHKTIAGYENERIEPSLSALDRLLPAYGVRDLRELADAVDRLRGGTVAEAPERYDETNETKLSISRPAHTRARDDRISI